MKSKLKRIATLFMTTLLITSTPLSVFASTNTENTLVNVVVSETDERTIIAQVPRDHVNEYNEKLEDPDFKQDQIDSLTINPLLPDGNIIAQKHLYRSTIKAACDRVESNAFERFIASYALPAAAVKMVNLLGATNFITATSAIIFWRIDDLRIKQEEWWKESYTKILEGSISCVRVSHIQNLKPTYPAAWLIIERL